MRSRVANVLDLELTCYKGNIFPQGEVADIIEVGVTMVDLDTLALGDTISIPIIPTRSTVSDYCWKLTGWTMDKLRRQGKSFADACKTLRRDKFGPLNRLLVSDSDGEAQVFNDHCIAFGIDRVFGDSRLNVSTQVELLTGIKSNTGLDAMLAAFGMQFEGKRHRAGDDSRNIARLFVHVMSLARQGLIGQFKDPQAG